MSKEKRGLPKMLGAKVTLQGEAPDAGAAAAAVALSPKKKEEESDPPLPKDSMRLSSLGEWLSTGEEAKVTDEEKTGIIGGIIAGLEPESESSSEEDALPAEKSSIMQLEELTDSVETVMVSLVLCRRRTRFLCIQELDGTWFVPGGTVDAGESCEGAASRNAMDEANVNIDVEGILRIEYSTSNGVRVRVIYKAQPHDPTILPKQDADAHSLQAKWLSTAALEKFRLRTDQILDMFRWVGPPEDECPTYSPLLMECPPFGPERCEINHAQTVTLLVHKAHLVLVDRKKRVFTLPDKSPPTMILKEGHSFLRFPIIMVNKYCSLFGLDAGSHQPEILHIWHAPPNPLDGVGYFTVTYVQRVRSEFPSSCHSINLDTIKKLNVAAPIRKRVKSLLKGDEVPTMPLSKFVPEGTPYKEPDE